MRTLIESFKRLYEGGKITKDDVIKRMQKGTITKQEAEYILSENIEMIKK